MYFDLMLLIYLNLRIFYSVLYCTDFLWHMSRSDGWIFDCILPPQVFKAFALAAWIISRKFINDIKWSDRSGGGGRQAGSRRCYNSLSSLRFFGIFSMYYSLWEAREMLWMNIAVLKSYNLQPLKALLIIVDIKNIFINKNA